MSSSHQPGLSVRQNLSRLDLAASAHARTVYGVVVGVWDGAKLAEGVEASPVPARIAGPVLPRAAGHVLISSPKT